MGNDQNDATAKTLNKSKKLIIFIVAAVVLLAGAGGVYFFTSRSNTRAAPAKGIITPLTDALTINLADGHYLKLNFSLQQTKDSASTAIDPAQAVNTALDVYTGKTVAALSTATGRNAAKAELLAAVEKDYNGTGSPVVMDIYYTAFVTQ